MSETYVLLGKTVERLHKVETALAMQNKKLHQTIQLLAKLKTGEIKLDWLSVAPDFSEFEVNDPAKKTAAPPQKKPVPKK